MTGCANSGGMPEALEARLLALTREHTEIRRDVESAADQAERAAARVAQAADHLAVVRRSDVRAVILFGGADLPTEPVAAAAALAEVLPDPPSDDDHGRNVAALDRAQKALLDDLHHGYDPAIAHHDGVTVVEITADRGTFGVDDLLQQLRNPGAGAADLPDGGRSRGVRAVSPQPGGARAAQRCSPTLTSSSPR